MELTPDDVRQLARLSRIAVSDDEVDSTLAQLNRVFGLIEKMQETDTTGIEPMTNPQPEPARLRDDVADEPDRRDDYQRVAPQVEDGLYLVPRVIE
ncbi:MAG: Asp-tRNA(Asn)/Glu-tRNA(Gln) amidotransferase subunit GatC [Burkholderiaceae bacterium]|jgi:aspartyl-tRNA(Asn)/glutamyl-tRNA(Gln) amidotransferase subunit C